MWVLHMRSTFMWEEGVVHWVYGIISSWDKPSLINCQFSQKLKLLENGEFNNLTIILTLLLTYGFKLPFNRTSCSDTMINYQFSQKFKMLENDEFNHLTIILTLLGYIRLLILKDKKEKRTMMNRFHQWFKLYNIFDLYMWILNM